MSPPPLRMSDSGRSVGGIQPMVDTDRRYSNDAGSLPYSRRVSESNSLQRRVSEAGSYMSTGSIDGRRSATPTGGLPYATASLERRPSGGLRAAQQHQQLSRRQSGEEPDVVLASATSKVSLAKQAMQQLTAELAELTGPSPSPPPQGLHRSAGGSGYMPPSAFAVAAAGGPSSQHTESRSSSRQGSMGLNVLGQPVQHQQPLQQQPQQPPGQGRNNAWSDYKNVWQQERQHRPAAGPAPMGEQESWNTMAGQDMHMPVYQQQQYDRRQFRVSTGSMSASGVYTPSGMMSPAMSPTASGAMMGGDGMQSGMPPGMPPGMPVNWPRLRGVFGNGVLSTEELVALYADSGAASEKKLISLLEEALAAAHAEKVSGCGQRRQLCW